MKQDFHWNFVIQSKLYIIQNLRNAKLLDTCYQL